MRYFFTIFLCSYLISCVSYKPQYADDVDVSKYKAYTGEIAYTIYLVGDAGNAPEGKTLNVLKYLKNELATVSDQSTIVWLGDNIYPVGLAPESDSTYKLGLHRINKQLEVHDDYKGQIFFIPGNHDWYDWGREGVKRQEKIIEDYLSNRAAHDAAKQTNYFLPDDGCGKVHAISLTDKIVIFLMDSAWFLKQTEKPETISDCEGQSRKYVLDQISELADSYKDKSIVFALHHPPYTYGSHGGHFKFKDYFFPLSQLKNYLLIPLPVSGLIANKMRQFISEQDVSHSRYVLLKDHIETELKKAGASLIVSGHEHNLQYIERNNNYYVISGAGSKNNPGTLGNGSQFSVGKKGFVKVKFKNALESILEYYVVDENGETAELLFQKEIRLKK